MDSRAEADDWAQARARVLVQLRERLESVEALSDGVRSAITRGDTAKIEASTARLETLAQEFKTLAEEYHRLNVPGRGNTEDRRVDEARASLRDTALRLARSSAVAGGLLARMVALSRGLLGMVGSATDGTYLPSGQAPHVAVEGIRLRERV